MALVGGKIQIRTIYHLHFSSDLGENMLIIEDVCINAKGYKDILEHKYKVVV